MKKATKAMLTGAALAGLFAGTGASVKASTLLPSLKTSFGAQDQGQDQDQKSDKNAKEKHACKGQNSCKGKGGCKASDNGCKGKNSCKGKGGCATDGSKPPQQ
jgi:membrane protease subunit (stomatin/prohibitin family)